MSEHILSDEDKELFKQAMSSVTPLSAVEKEPIAKPPRKPLAPKKPSSTLERPFAKTNLSDFIQEHVQTETILSYKKAPLANSRFRELQRGKIRWEARLDLHGLHTEAARAALGNFLAQQLSQGHRCVLIIHGKGGHQGQPPVIKNLVNRWLPQWPEILAFHSAQAKDGGNGAVYVLLNIRKS